jgi:hypothetical protein
MKERLKEIIIESFVETCRLFVPLFVFTIYLFVVMFLIIGVVKIFTP